MLKLVIADDEGKKTVVPLVRDEITIGRKEGNTIRLTERNVSRRHARIVRRASDYLLEDLASYNGIVVNNTRLVEARPIRHGDEIRIGDYTLQIVDEPGVQPAPSAPPSVPVASEPIVPLLSATPPAASAAGSPLASHNDPLAPARPATETASQPVPESIKGLRLVFLAPAGVPPPVMLDRLPIVMGRSEGADVALPFSSISREHARLFLEDDKLMIEDMGSSNGVQINGDKCRKGQLGPGDMVQLGVVEFRVARRGDNTVMIQKSAIDEKLRASRRPPIGLIGAIVGGGLALGLAVVLVVNKMNPNPAVSPAAQNTTTAAPQPLAVTPPVVAPPPEHVEHVVPAQPETPPVQPAAVAPTPPETPPQAAQPEQPPVVVPPPVPTQPETPPAQAAQPAAPEVQAPAPAAPETPPVRQTLETSSQRRARERAERQHAPPAAAPREARTAPAAPTPAARPTPAPAPTPAAPAAAANNDDGQTPMQRAQACRSSTSDEPARNNCIINALRGHANSMQELGMLAATQMTANRSADAVRTMRTYIQRYPQGPLLSTFQRYIDSHP